VVGLRAAIVFCIASVIFCSCSHASSILKSGRNTTPTKKVESTTGLSTTNRNITTSSISNSDIPNNTQVQTTITSGTITSEGPAGVSLLDTSERAFLQLPALGYSGTLNNSGLSLDVSGYAYLNSGIQKLSYSNGAAATMELVSGNLYVNSNQSGLVDLLGFSNPESQKFDNTWVEIKPGDQLFAQLSQNIDLQSLYALIYPSNGIFIGKKETLNNQSVIPVSGNLNANISGQTETINNDLYLSASTPYLPLVLHASATISGQGNLSQSLTFSLTNIPPAPTPPINPITCSLIPSCA
jgi:hypothetical protein